MSPFDFLNAINSTKENLFEHGIPLSVVFLSSRNKTLDIYRKEDFYYDENSETHLLSQRDDRHDREQSCFSLRGVPIDENDIRMKIAKNNDILENLSDIFSFKQQDPISTPTTDDQFRELN